MLASTETIGVKELACCVEIYRGPGGIVTALRQVPPLSEAVSLFGLELSGFHNVWIRCDAL